VVVVCDPERVRTRAHDLVRTSQEFLEASWATAATGGKAPVDLGAAAYKGLVEVRAHATAHGHPWWTVSPFTADEDLDDNSVVLAARAPQAYLGETARALEDVRRWLSDGYAGLLTTVGHGPAERLVEVLRAADVPAALSDVPLPGAVAVTTASLEAGFASDLL
jgi:transcription-repair coupling factor (superfamily II helicase)